MRGMRWFDFLTINAYWLGSSFIGSAMGPLIGPILVQQFVGSDNKNGAYGDVSAAGLLVAMAVQPAFGLLSDRCNLPYGRRRPFIILGAILTVLSLVFVGGANSYLILFAALLFQQFPINVGMGAAQGLIPDRVPVAQRGRASAVKAIFDLLPVVLVAYTVAPIVSTGNINLALAVLAAIFLVTSMVTVVASPEEQHREREVDPVWRHIARIVLLAFVFYGIMLLMRAGAMAVVAQLVQARAPIILGALAGCIGMVGAILLGVWSGSAIGLGRQAIKDSSFTWWIVNRLFFLAAITSLQRFALYFLQDMLSLSQEDATRVTANLFVAVGIFTLLSALPSGWIADRFSRRGILLVTGLLGVAGILLLLNSTTLTMVYISGAILGLSAGAFMTTNWALGTSLAPPTQAGRYLGISNLAGAGAGMVGAGIGGALADIFNQMSPGSGYQVIFMIYGVLFLLSTISLLGIKRHGAESPAPIGTTTAEGAST